MFRLFLAAILLAAPITHVAAAGERESMIISASWLSSHLADADLVLLHVGTPDGYAAAHIPGARHISTADISTPRAEGALILELPPAEKLVAAFEKLGVSNSSRVVIYWGEDWVSPTTRVYFTLDYLGLGDRTSVLNGGMKAWVAAGNRVTTELPTVKPGSIKPKARPELIVDADWVKSRLNQTKVAIVDARDGEFYDGTKPGNNMRPGHIPSAKSLPFSTLVVDPQLTFVDGNGMRALLQKAGAEKGDTVVPYCHIGQQATVVYFAARYLGYDVRLYDGSFQDWSKRADLPVVTTEGARER